MSLHIDRGQPTNNQQSAYIPDWVISRREPLRIVGPFFFGSSYDPEKKDLLPAAFVHMDLLVFGGPVVELTTDNGSPAWVYRGTALIAQGQNVIMPYTAEEFEQALSTWNPAN